MYYMLDAKIPSWPWIKVSLTSRSSVLQPRVKRRDRTSPPPHPQLPPSLFNPPPPLGTLHSPSCPTIHFLSHVATQPATSLVSERMKTEPKLDICLGDRAALSRGEDEVMAESGFKGLGQTQRQRGQSEAARCIQADVAASRLCQQDRLFTVAANELELWPVG